MTEKLESFLENVCCMSQEELEDFAFKEVIEAFERIVKNPSEHDCQEG